MTYKVRVLATWDGFCGRCRDDERPLVLTLAGPGGFGSWIRGDDWEDRDLLLTCRVCGAGQHVPWHEEDDVDPVEHWIDLEPPDVRTVDLAAGPTVRPRISVDLSQPVTATSF